MKNWFEQQLSQGFKGIIHSYDKRVEKGHHRTEKRQIWCVPISQLQTLHNQDNQKIFVFLTLLKFDQILLYLIHCHLLLSLIMVYLHHYS